MGIRITDKMVKELTPPAKGNRIVYDDGKTGVSGFGIRITAGGARSWVLNYRNADGRERRATLGAYPATPVEAARKAAGKLKSEIRLDARDPVGERAEKIKAPTVGQLCDRYIKEWLPKKRPRSASDDKAMIANIIRPKLGTRKLATVTYSDIDQLHREVSEATPYRANRVLALLCKMFNLSIRWGWRADNPTKGVERNPEVKRERYLEGPEIARLTQALAGHKDRSAANIVRLLLLTGARRGEVLSAAWSQFDLDVGVWSKPAASTKQGKPHRVPLSEGAVALLKGVFDAAPREDDGTLASPHVFPAPLSGNPRTEIKDEWRLIAIAAGLYDDIPPTTKGGKSVKMVNCRVHDLRHTYASLLVSAGLSLPIIGALLGHTQASTTHRYAHLMDDPLRAATNTVSAIVTGKKSAEIVPIEGAAV